MDDKRCIPGRRLYARFETNTSAMVGAGADAAETVLMENISARGAAVLGYKQFSMNDRLSIFFYLPFVSERMVHKQAHVAWCAEVKDGVWETGLDFGMDNMVSFR